MYSLKYLLAALVCFCLSVIPARSEASDTHDKSASIRQYLAHKEWVGPKGEYLRVGSDSAMLIVDMYMVNYAPYRVQGNDIVFTIYTYSSQRGYYSYTDTATIESISKDTLVLSVNRQPANWKSIKGKESIVFVNRAKLYDPSITFQKVFFSFQNGGGAMQVAIDSIGILLWSVKPGIMSRHEYSGTFKGRLSAVELKHLVELVKKSIPGRFTCSKPGEDGGWTAFRIYYNHTMVDAEGGQPSYLAIDLRNFLMGMPADVHVEKISDKFGLEGY